MGIDGFAPQPGPAPEASAVDVPTDDDSFHGSAGRGGVPGTSLDQKSASASAPSSVPTGSSAEHRDAANTAKPPAADNMVCDMAARRSKMFVVGAPGPVASDMRPVVAAASNELVKAAFDAIKSLCDRDGKALSSSFGNFDRIVGLGWLIGDALGHGLLSREDAFKLGGVASKRAKALPSEIADARRAILRPASKLDAADPKRKELAAAADAAQARLLQSAPDPQLPLPKPHTSAKPQATGSRKRARSKPEPPAADPVAEARLNLSQAERALTKAKRKYDAASAARDRAVVWAKRTKSPPLFTKKGKCLIRRWATHRDATHAHHHASVIELVVAGYEEALAEERTRTARHNLRAEILQNMCDMALNAAENGAPSLCTVAGSATQQKKSAGSE